MTLKTILTYRHYPFPGIGNFIGDTEKSGQVGIDQRGQGFVPDSLECYYHRHCCRFILQLASGRGTAAFTDCMRGNSSRPASCRSCYPLDFYFNVGKNVHGERFNPKRSRIISARILQICPAPVVHGIAHHVPRAGDRSRHMDRRRIHHDSDYCGVVLPHQQRRRSAHREIREAIRRIRRTHEATDSGDSVNHFADIKSAATGLFFASPVTELSKSFAVWVGKIQSKRSNPASLLSGIVSMSVSD